MSPRWLRTGTLQYVTLWALTAILVTAALGDVALFGVDPGTLAVLAAVLAASTAVYEDDDRCQTA